MKNSTKKYVYGVAAVVTGIGTIAADVSASKYLKKHLGKSSKTTAGIVVSTTTSIGIHSTLGGITALLIASAVESHKLDMIDKKYEEDHDLPSDEYDEDEEDLFDEDFDLDDDENQQVDTKEEIESDTISVKSSDKSDESLLDKDDDNKTETEKESDYELVEDDN